MLSEQNNHQDFQWAFGLNRLSLDLIGIWPNEKDPGGRTGFKYLRVPFMVICLLVGIFVPQMYALVQIFTELPLVVDNLTTSCAAFTSSIKLFALWNSRRVFQQVVNVMTVDWLRQKTKWERQVMMKQARHARIFTISGYAIMFACFVGFIATPFFGLSIRIINNITDTVDGRFFPLQTYYPYDFARSPYFELTYLTQLIAGSFVGISFSVPDNFFAALVFHATGQCEILSQKMAMLLPDNGFKWMECNRKVFRLRLRRLVETHVRLIRFVVAVESSFNLLILAQVLCLSLVICCLGFGVVKSIGSENNKPPVVQVVTLVGTLLNLMIHMFVCCLASERLLKHSLDFLHAIYSSSWYLLPKKMAADIILIMIRSEHPLRLTVGKFFYLSLNTYLNILKTSGGYISMLLAVSS